MHIINLTPLTEGVYNDHCADHITAPPEGWAYIPEDFPLPSTFPRLGSIEAEEMTYTREVEVQKTREVPMLDDEGNPAIGENGLPLTEIEEYTEVEEREYTMMTVTAMTEGTLPDPVPEDTTPTTEERVTALEEQLAETDEVAILLYEASLEQEAVNTEQDEAIIEIYETMEVLLNG